MYDELDFGFVILSPEHNVGRIQGTIRSIRNHYGVDVPIICVVDKGASAAEVKEIKELCSTYKGKDTITSILNTAMKRGHKEWNILVIEGTWVRRKLNYKYKSWIQDRHDILFPIVCDYDRDGIPRKIHKDFYNCSLNGLCINQKTFKEVGKFSENPLEVSRRFWALEAASKGVRFKAILGTRLG